MRISKWISYLVLMLLSIQAQAQNLKGIGMSCEIDTAGYTTNIQWDSLSHAQKTQRLLEIQNIDRFIDYINLTSVKVLAGKYLVDSIEVACGRSFLTPYENSMLCAIDFQHNQPQAIRDQLEIFNIILVKRLGVSRLELTNPRMNIDTLSYLLEMINSPVTLTFIINQTNTYLDNCLSSFDNEYAIRNNLQVVVDRLNLVTSKRYSDYSNTYTGNVAFKGAELYLLNDLFTISCVAFGLTPNLDRNYTGAGFLEFRTDYFKWRYNPLSYWAPNSIFDINGTRWLSYQGIDFGLDVYTPRIQDELVYAHPERHSTWDRPFFNFKYFGRTVYRMNLQENIKMTGTLKIGVIGSPTAEKVQSTLHRDVTVASVTPQGWQSQIANGGRWGIQYEYKLSALLVSNDHGICRKRKPFSDYLNIYTDVMFQVGHVYGAGQFSARFTNVSFNKTNGRNFVLNRRTAFVLDAGATIGYCGWNGTLQGYGFLKHTLDNDTLSPYDDYYLEANEIKHLQASADIYFGYKIGDVQLFWKSVFYLRDFDIDESKSTIGKLHPSGYRTDEEIPIGYYYGIVGATYRFRK